jgi:hypothetical protein
VLVVEATPVTRSSLALEALWDNDIGAGAWASLRHRITAHTPVELHAGVMVDELARRGSLDASLFSSVLPGLIWNGGAHGSEERVRAFEGFSPAGAADVRRLGGWLGAERQGTWSLSALLRSDHVRDDVSARSGWSSGPFLQVARAEEPNAVVGAPPLLQLDWRFGELEYRRVRARAGAGAALGGLQGAVFVDVAGSSRQAPADVLPATSRRLAPWLPAGALRQPGLGVVGLDAAWPIVLDGFLRARLRLVGSGAAEPRPDEARWRGGGELGAVWPTIIGRLEVGLAAGSGGSRLNIGIGNAP